MEISADDLRKLRLFVTYRIHDKYEAEDIIQDATVKAMEYATRFRGESAVSTWLQTIAYSIICKRAKHTKVVRKYMVEGLEAEDFEMSDCCNPLDILEAEEAKSNITRLPAAMANLTENFRRTLQLVFLNEMSYPQAAAEMHIPVGTVKSRVNRACAALRLEYGA